MRLSGKVRETSEAEKALTAAGLAATAAPAAAHPRGCVRARRGRSQARARAGRGGTGPGGREDARSGRPVGRGRCVPAPRSACPRSPSAAVRLEQPPKSAWRHFEAERRRHGGAGCGRGGGRRRLDAAAAADPGEPRSERRLEADARR